jgi:sugar O-acyltransferase (sialic acid O-acetyltransferase NeuD family)
MQRLLIIGSGGHARVVVEIATSLGWSVVGLIDDTRLPGPAFAGLTVIGATGDLLRLRSDDIYDALCVAVGDNHGRRVLVQQIEALVKPVVFPTLVHPRASVSSSARLGAGAVVCAGAVVGPDAVVGDHAVVNTLASLDHEATLGAFASLGPHAAVGGGAQVGSSSLVAMSATVLQRVSIGQNTVVGSGAVAVSDLPSRVVAMGIPAKVARSRKPEENHL